jgi:hypothetical protein
LSKKTKRIVEERIVERSTCFVSFNISPKCYFFASLLFDGRKVDSIFSPPQSFDLSGVQGLKKVDLKLYPTLLKYFNKLNNSKTSWINIRVGWDGGEGRVRAIAEK